MDIRSMWRPNQNKGETGTGWLFAKREVREVLYLWLIVAGIAAVLANVMAATM